MPNSVVASRTSVEIAKTSSVTCTPASPSNSDRRRAINTSPFPTLYEEFIHKSRYARWLVEEGRRENWDETVDRLVTYYTVQIMDKWSLDEIEYHNLHDAIYNL